MKKQILLIHGATSFGNQEQFLEYLNTETVRMSPKTSEVEPHWKDDLVTRLEGEYDIFMRRCLTSRMPSILNGRLGSKD